MAPSPWKYQQSRGKRKIFSEEKYQARLADLQNKTNWEDEELRQLQKHLAPLNLPEKMEHLDILHRLPRNYIDYQPTRSRSRKRPRTSHEKELKITSNIEPWKFEVRFFMGNSYRVPATGFPDEVHRLRAINDGISDLMMRDGWCQSTISLIRHAVHVPGLHLAMLLCAPTTRNPVDRNHSRCTRTKCQALQVNPYTHTARHLHPTCSRSCSSIGADEGKLDDTILGDPDGIPRVVLPSRGSLPPVLEVSNQGSFIAISHVWSHSFSYSPSENAMPACQLERLREFVNELQGMPPSHQVWMDAFCIPERPSKPKAMSRIAKTFRQATKIMVLDAKLLQTSCKVSPFVQAIRILSSDWVRRLWTLEEAILGCTNAHLDKLYFRFSDGFVTLQTLLQNLRSTQCPYSHSAVLGLERHLTFRLVPDWRTWSPKHNGIASRFAQLARALEYRNTSKRSDELMCMASILGLPTRAILEADSPEDRAIAFYKTLKTVPASILFCNGVRISKQPFRWAIASFIAAEDPRKLQTLSKTTRHFGLCESDGLHLRATGIYFEFDENETMFNFNRIWIRPERLSLEPSSWGFPCDLPPWQSWSEIGNARAAGDQLILMINPNCDHEAVVLRHLKKTAQAIHAAYLTTVHIRYVGKRDSSVEDEPMWRSSSSSASAGEDDDSDVIADSRWTDVVDPSRFICGTFATGRRSISARSTLHSSELQKWIIT